MDITKIYETTDLSIFNKLDGNRDVTNGRLKKLEKESTERINIPIIVNEKMEVIDGQGRLALAKKHNLPIRYYFVPGAEITACINFNTHSTSMTPKEIMTLYCAKGNENYIRLSMAAQENNAGIVMTLYAASRDAATTVTKKSCFGNSDFIFSESDYQKATNALKKLNELLVLCSRDVITEALKRTFLSAIKSESIGYDHKTMVMQLTKYGSFLVKHSAMPECMENIAKIYNWRRRNKFMAIAQKNTHGKRKLVFDSSFNPY